MRSQSPTTMSSCHVTESLETLSASEHDRRAMTSSGFSSALVSGLSFDGDNFIEG